MRTRQLLLDSAVQVLLEGGYARFSTLRVSEQAGVSRGKQVYHFPTRDALLSAALGHLLEQYTAELRQRWQETAPKAEGRVGAVLDLLWQAHGGQLFRTSLEMLVSARQDPALRRAVVEFERSVTAVLFEQADALLGECARRDGFADALHTSLSAMRGLALTRSVYPGSEEEFQALWDKTRAQLLRLF